MGGTTTARAQRSFQGKVTRVRSGDEIIVRLDAWDITVRLHGVACPTRPASLAELARRYTARRVLNTPVRVEVRGTAAQQTIYGEVEPAVAFSGFDGDTSVPAATKQHLSLNKELVNAGLATWAREYAPNRTDLLALENRAQKAKRGLWSNPPGEDVPMPPFAVALLPASPKPKVPSPVTVTPPAFLTPTLIPIVAATPSPTPFPRPAPRRPATVRQAAHLPAKTPGVMLLVCLLTFAALTAFLYRQPYGETEAWQRRSVAFVGLIGLLGGIAAALLVPLALVIATAGPLFATPPLVAGTAGLAAPLCWWYAFHLCRREQILRATPPCLLGEVTGSNSLVRVTGRADRWSTTAQSHIGQVEGIYIREVTQCYEAAEATGYTGTRRRKTAHRWVTTHAETRTTDFLVEDGSGTAAAIVEGDRARFHPLRVARYYNDVPVESWFNRPYAGDTRTEVHYIPLHAEVTVWGHLYQTAPPDPSNAENRIGFDSLHRCLEVVEGDGARLWSVRPLIGLLFTLLGVGCLLVAVSAVINPGVFPVL